MKFRLEVIKSQHQGVLSHTEYEQSEHEVQHELIVWNI